MGGTYPTTRIVSAFLDTGRARELERQLPRGDVQIPRQSPSTTAPSPTTPVGKAPRPPAAARAVGALRWVGPVGAIIAGAMIAYEVYRRYYDRPAIKLPPTPAGFTMYLTCPKPPGEGGPLHLGYGWAPWPNVCLTFQGLTPGFFVGEEGPIPAGGIWNNVAHVWVHKFSEANPVPRLDSLHIYSRPFNPGVPAEVKPFVMPLDIPLPSPFEYVERWLDPMATPVGEPQPATPLPYEALPHRQPNPDRDPREQTTRGYRVPYYWPYYWPRPVIDDPYPWLPWPDTRPTRPPVVRPKPPVEPDVDPRIPPVVRPPIFPPVPPKKKERERKLKIKYPVAAVPLMRLFGKWTEFTDFEKALWDALPKCIRSRQRAQRHGKRPNQAQRLRDIYDNFGDIDLNRAIRNVLKNELGDQFIGRTANAFNRTAGRTGITGRHVLGDKGSRPGLTGWIDDLLDALLGPLPAEEGCPKRPMRVSQYSGRARAPETEWRLL